MSKSPATAVPTASMNNPQQNEAETPMAGCSTMPSRAGADDGRNGSFNITRRSSQGFETSARRNHYPQDRRSNRETGPAAASRTHTQSDASRYHQARRRQPESNYRMPDDEHSGSESD